MSHYSKQTALNAVQMRSASTQPHSATLTTKFLQQFKWDVLEHPPYSTDLAPNDLYLSPKLKGILGGSRIGSSSKLKDTNGEW